MNYEREYVQKALDAVRPWHYILPTDVQRALQLAQSVIATHGSATAAEMRKELGPKWVIGRRTPRIVEKYGEDVRCVSIRQYDEAERRAIESRTTA